MDNVVKLETLIILMFICLLGITLASDSVIRIIWLFIWAIVLGFCLHEISKKRKEELLRKNEGHRP